MTDQPLVSVITASYQMGDYVVEAVRSVLAQDYPHLESIVVNDGSTDHTREVLDRLAAEDPRVTVIHQENAGQTVAKNRGWRASRGEYIGWCDADNRWRPDKLTRQLAAFREHPEVGVVYGDIQLIDGEGRPRPNPPIRRYSGRITGKLLIDNFVTFNTTLVPRRILEAMNGLDENLRMAIDYDLWLRISLEHDFLHLPETLVDYRIWEGQMSHRTEERMDNFFRLLERFLAEHPDKIPAADARMAWAHSLTTRGRYYASVGRKADAWRDYRRALGHRPWDTRTIKSMGRLALRGN
ncbi:MAG: glycosyltransferase [Candidatus Krumholzibacteriia bacterium]